MRCDICSLEFRSERGWQNHFNESVRHARRVLLRSNLPTKGGVCDKDEDDEEEEGEDSDDDDDDNDDDEEEEEEEEQDDDDGWDEMEVATGECTDLPPGSASSMESSTTEDDLPFSVNKLYPPLQRYPLELEPPAKDSLHLAPFPPNNPNSKVCFKKKMTSETKNASNGGKPPTYLQYSNDKNLHLGLSMLQQGLSEVACNQQLRVIRSVSPEMEALFSPSWFLLEKLIVSLIDLPVRFFLLLFRLPLH